MLMTPTAPHTPFLHLLNTMQQADPRLLHLVRALAFALMGMSLAVAAMGCSAKVQVMNEGLDQATLLLFAALPALYLSGLRRS